jgi:hypothetical protein
MFISVQFGYNQARLFNINCQIAPLLDSISSSAYADMLKNVKKREAFFQKEILGFQRKEAVLIK